MSVTKKKSKNTITLPCSCTCGRSVTRHPSELRTAGQYATRACFARGIPGRPKRKKNSYMVKEEKTVLFTPATGYIYDISGYVGGGLDEDEVL